MKKLIFFRERLKIFKYQSNILSWKKGSGGHFLKKVCGWKL
jgi:hypothetical protein